MSPTNPPKICRAARIVGKTLVFRDACIADAKFILNLRTDAQKGKHLSATSTLIEDQKSWLQNYSQSTDQAYFIIERNARPIGTVRIYDPRGSSFSWGSWIISEGQPASAAMESALMVYSYALDHLGFTSAHFDVRKTNKSVWKFHERFGAKRVRETNIDLFFEIDEKAIRHSLCRHSKFLPEKTRAYSLFQ